MENYSVDCVGDICPIPLIKAKINYGRLNPGESVTIITDHSCSCSNIKDYFFNMNAQISVEEEGGIWHINIKKETFR